MFVKDEIVLLHHALQHLDQLTGGFWELKKLGLER
jgi:hypothetical protein